MLTSIQGAAELLGDQDARMTRAQRQKFLDNISSDAERLTILVERLRDLARADNPQLGGSCQLAETVRQAGQGVERLAIEMDITAKHDTQARRNGPRRPERAGIFLWERTLFATRKGLDA